MEMGKDYVFRDDLYDDEGEGNTCPIEIKLDPFTGIVYRYTTVKFRVDENDVPRISFDYEIMKTNDLSMMTLRKNEKFSATLGLILNALLLESEDVSENRTDDTEKPDQE